MESPVQNQKQQQSSSSSNHCPNHSSKLNGSSHSQICLEKSGIRKHCTFSLGNSEEWKNCPHILNDSPNPHVTPKICANVLEAVGNTPLIRLNNLPQIKGFQQYNIEILAKCEYMNPGGSSKDRIGMKMILCAQKEGKIRPGDLVVEPSSGNTGIGLALACIVRGYPLCVTMNEKMSQDKVALLKALGAKIVRANSEASSYQKESYLNLALKIKEDNQITEKTGEKKTGAFLCDQYSNPYNGLAHFQTAAQEILYQCDGNVDYVVIGAGTMGTISGIGRKLKMKLPNVKIVGADPVGSILAHPDDRKNAGGYSVQGIGRKDFVPRNADLDIVDIWIKVGDKEGFRTARDVLLYQGLLCGSSSGSATMAAIKLVQQIGVEKMKNKRIVVHYPDSIRNYMSRYLKNEWMLTHGYMNEQEVVEKQNQQFHVLPKIGSQSVIKDMIKKGDIKPLKESLVYGVSTGVEAMKMFESTGHKYLPVLKSTEGDFDKIEGVISSKLLLVALHRYKSKIEAPFTSHALDKFPRYVKLDMKVSDAIQLFKQHDYLLTIDAENKVLYVIDEMDCLSAINNSNLT